MPVNFSSGTPTGTSEYKLGESVGYVISHAQWTMSRMVTQRTIVELGVTSQQGSILLMVASGKCVLAADLAREYGIDSSAVTRLVDRLEKRYLITRARSSEDRRILQLALPPEGQRIAVRIPAIFSGVLDDLLSGFTPEEVGCLKSMLKRLLANADSQLLGPTGSAATSFCNGA